MIIRPAKPGDEIGINQIEITCFSEPWSINSIASELKKDSAIMLVAEENDKIVGWAGFEYYLPDGDITNVGVLPEYRGKQIGKQLVLSLIEKAKAIKLTNLMLEVRVSNAVAYRLYTSCNFIQVGKRNGFYDKPKEDALLLRCEL